MSQINTKLLERFSNDFAQLLETEYEYNVIVKVDKQNFKLHSLVLYQRSSFFRQELTSATKKNNIIEITLTDISVEAFKILIKYIYTGTIPLEEVEPSIIFDLLVPSKKLGLVELVEYIQSYLIDNKSSWLKLKFTQVYSTSFQDYNFKALQTFCTDILAKHPNLIFDSDDLTSIQENALVTLLKKDDLQIEESEIWDKVIQWGKAKTPDLPSDLKQWTEKNFLDLKNTLSKCIPLIRYFQIPGEDILAKVKPYRQILEFNLWDDISAKLIAPNAPISSTILPARKKIPI
ncbi:BTB/POZ protein, partial [Gigaspora rosea]